MGPRRNAADPASGSAIVFEQGCGSNVIDVDGNRYVDLAAGFGALLLGHAPPAVLGALAHQSGLLLQALGDVHSSDVRVELMERLARLHAGRAQVILGQSGADAITAALKTAALWTGRPGVVAFRGAYHGLSYGPLALCGLRASYRTPFTAQLNPAVRFVDYPGSDAELGAALERVVDALSDGTVGAVVVEPVLGRGGCIVPPSAFLPALAVEVRRAGALLVADEIWTGLGRTGSWLCSLADGVEPDLVCLGKGLGGGVPLSACVGRAEVMQAWAREEEVVHTATFAGAPLAAAAGLATLQVLEGEHLIRRAHEVGARFRAELRRAMPEEVSVRGRGLMVALGLSDAQGRAAVWASELLRRGYIVSTGGGAREVLVLTPALTIAEELLGEFVSHAVEALQKI